MPVPAAGFSSAGCAAADNTGNGASASSTNEPKRIDRRI
jgi:hypothetical protein